MKKDEQILKNKFQETSDPEIAKIAIWKKIETKLDKKTKPLFIWQKLSTAAIILAFIGLGLYTKLKTEHSKESIITLKNLPKKEIKNQLVVAKEKYLISFKTKRKMKKYRLIQNQNLLSTKLEFVSIEPIPRLNSTEKIVTYINTNIPNQLKIKPKPLAIIKPAFKTIHEDEFNQIKIEKIEKARSFVLTIRKKEENEVQNNSLIIPLYKSN